MQNIPNKPTIIKGRLEATSKKLLIPSIVLESAKLWYARSCEIGSIKNKLTKEMITSDAITESRQLIGQLKFIGTMVNL